MAVISRRLDALWSTSPAEAARLVFRKAVHRKVQMDRYEMPAGASCAPAVALELDLEILGPESFGEVLATNPHHDPDDLSNFERQRSSCIVVRDGDRIAASSWMTQGDVHVHELQRTVRVPDHEHFSCRSYVDPDYRGLNLLSHMIHAYSAEQSPTDVVWGLVYRWNVASVRSLERLGWRHTGEYWARYVFDQKITGERHFAPRPPSSL